MSKHARKEMTIDETTYRTDDAKNTSTASKLRLENHGIEDGVTKYIVHDDSMNGREEVVSVEHTNVSVKFSFLNNSGIWTLPREYETQKLKNKSKNRLVSSTLKY